MDAILTNIQVIAPTFLAIISLALFTRRTRLLCYATIVLAITSELIPMAINLTALMACTICLAALVIEDCLRHYSITHPSFGR